MDKQYIHPQELRNWWHFVRPGLEHILKKSPEYWIPEDVYADCYSGKAHLWVFSEQNQPRGFAVLEARGEDLHCWCGWSDGSGYFKDGFQDVFEIAKANGFKYVTFESWRSGWDRVAPTFGFKPRKWIKEIL